VLLGLVRNILISSAILAFYFSPLFLPFDSQTLSIVLGRRKYTNTRKDEDDNEVNVLLRLAFERMRGEDGWWSVANLDSVSRISRRVYIVYLRKVSLAESLSRG
jgi:hypothetical protein